MRLVLIYILLFPICALSEAIVIGASDFNQRANYLTGQHPFSFVIMESVSYPLLRYQPETSALSMLLADKISSSENIWEIRIRDGLEFSNKNKASLADKPFKLGTIPFFN